jgi:hypothetical protein
MSVTTNTLSTFSDHEWFLIEPLLTFGQLARLLSVNPASTWRWSSKGCFSKKGRRVMLESRRIGGRNMTSLQRFREFTNRLNDDEKAPPPMVAARLPVNPSNVPGGSQIDASRQAKEATEILAHRGVLD